MDSYLPTPADSIILDRTGTKKETRSSGNPQGLVTSGPFSSWTTIERHPTITRKVGAEGSVFNESNIMDFMAFTDINKALAPTAPRAYTHGNVHLRHARDGTSANDPIFSSHHSFVDLLWEAWRLAHQDYPLDNNLCSSNFHFSSAFMKPFRPWRNSDGLTTCTRTTSTSTRLVRPAPPAGTASTLFCLRSPQQVRLEDQAGRQLPRVGTPPTNPATTALVKAGKCVATGANEPTTRRPPVAPKPPVGPRGQDETCFNSHQCCAVWSGMGECNRNPGYMRPWCKASCGACNPRSYSLSVG
ncbi:CRE-TYR-3 protein [Aphelenchoides fujianensis]|nr:CRE-TYR-3 protein [Aphelenchoides fujianensis]